MTMPPQLINSAWEAHRKAISDVVVYDSGMRTHTHTHTLGRVTLQEAEVELFMFPLEEQQSL